MDLATGLLAVRVRRAAACRCNCGAGSITWRSLPRRGAQKSKIPLFFPLMRQRLVVRDVAGAEASVDVVVDHADVLHERVHAGWADESVSLRLELAGERFRLRGGCRHGCDGSR